MRKTQLREAPWRSTEYRAAVAGMMSQSSEHLALPPSKVKEECGKTGQLLQPYEFVEAHPEQIVQQRSLITSREDEPGCCLRYESS